MRTAIKMAGRLAAALGLLGLGAATAFAVQISVPTASGNGGQTVNVTINTSNLTGLNVDSYQFGLQYDANLVTPTGLVTTSTLTGAAGFTAQFGTSINAGTGTLSVSAAGTTPLSGAGGLLIVSFLINPAQLTGSSTGLTFTNFMMNEGTPKDTTTNSSITINGTPTFGISPPSGEIIRGQTLQFSTFGSATPPITWGTTNSAIATMSGTGLLTGVSPGSVQVTAVDNVSLHAITTGSVLVRGMGMTVGTASVFAGQPVSIPITVTALDGLGIRSGQIQIAYAPSVVTFTSVTTPAGTILNGYGSSVAAAANGVVTFAFAGTTDLAGSGTLCYLNFNTTTGVPGVTSLTLNSALFNETLQALKTSGLLTVTGLSTLSVSPFTLTLYDGQTQTFTAGGGAVPPLTWSSTNPAVATIDPVTGILTAVSGGTTQVKVLDSDGASGTSGVISIYDCKLTVGTVAFPPGSVAQVPLSLDRNINNLGVYSMQYTVSWSSTYITNATSQSSGIGLSWGGPVYNFTPGQIKVAAAGKAPLGFGTTLAYVNLALSPSVPNGTVIPLTLSGFMFNEGQPVAFITNGQITVNAALGVGGADLAFGLGAAQPNPARSETRLSFVIPASAGPAATAVLALYGVNGARVRTLYQGNAEAGAHTASWDLRDDAGRRVSAGVYFARLEWNGRREERSLSVVR